ncbi:MAG: hypothetical protein LZF62_350045 [Nitrospira sp.]|nr:MAG: hypothetical protein LZF62_350045 [Nitrospira sp.]
MGSIFTLNQSAVYSLTPKALIDKWVDSAYRY